MDGDPRPRPCLLARSTAAAFSGAILIFWRCYYCKTHLFQDLAEIARSEGLRHVVYGATEDDLGDHRPGMRAARELGARAPLLEAGLTKDEVRALSQEMGLPTWDKPAMACLASRFPYDATIAAEALGSVERAEDFLRREVGLRQVRVRHHGNFLIGELLFGISVIRAGVFSKVAAVLFISGMIPVALDLSGIFSESVVIIASIVAGLGLIWWSISLYYSRVAMDCIPPNGGYADASSCAVGRTNRVVKWLQKRCVLVPRTCVLSC